MQTMVNKIKVKQPPKSDVEAVLREVDENFDMKVDKERFVQLIERVLMKFLESEEELKKTKNTNYNHKEYSNYIKDYSIF